MLFMFVIIINLLLGKDATISKKVFIGGLPTQVTEDEIRAVFLQFGPVSITLKHYITLLMEIDTD